MSRYVIFHLFHHYQIRQQNLILLVSYWSNFAIASFSRLTNCSRIQKVTRIQDLSLTFAKHKEFSLRFLVVFLFWQKTELCGTHLCLLLYWIYFFSWRGLVGVGILGNMFCNMLKWHFSTESHMFKSCTKVRRQKLHRDVHRHSGLHSSCV